jgi:hypothetical protein
MANKILRLTDGLDVICSVVFEKDNKLIVENPMLFELRGPNLVLQYWLPMAVLKSDSVEISMDSIMCFMDPSDDFSEYYDSTMIRMKNLEKKESEVELNDEVLAAVEEKETRKSLLH